MIRRRLLFVGLLAPLALLLVACNEHGYAGPPLNRFQAFTSSTETLLVDSATGDLWKLDESPGDEPGHWIRYAEAPGDARPLAELIRSAEEAQAEAPAAEEPHEENHDGDNPDGGGGEEQNQDG